MSVVRLALPILTFSARPLVRRLSYVPMLSRSRGIEENDSSLRGADFSDIDRFRDPQDRCPRRFAEIFPNSRTSMDLSFNFSFRHPSCVWND